MWTHLHFGETQKNIRKDWHGIVPIPLQFWREGEEIFGLPIKNMGVHLNFEDGVTLVNKGRRTAIFDEYLASFLANWGRFRLGETEFLYPPSFECHPVLEMTEVVHDEEAISVGLKLEGTCDSPGGPYRFEGQKMVTLMWGPYCVTEKPQAKGKQIGFPWGLEIQKTSVKKYKLIGYEMVEEKGAAELRVLINHNNPKRVMVKVRIGDDAFEVVGQPWLFKGPGYCQTNHDANLYFDRNEIFEAVQPALKKVGF